MIKKISNVLMRCIVMKLIRYNDAECEQRLSKCSARYCNFGNNALDEVLLDCVVIDEGCRACTEISS